MQALQELEAGVLTAVGQLQLFAVEVLVSGGQTVRLLTHAEAGDPGAPGQVVQRILHHDLALPLGLGQLPDVGDGRTVGISLGVVEELSQLNVQRSGGGGVLGVDVGEDVSGLVVVELAALDVFDVHGAVLVLDVDHVSGGGAGVILTGDLLQQLVGGNIKGHALQAGILCHESIGNLGAAGGDGVQGHGSAFLQGLLIQFLVGLVGVVDAGLLLPLGQIGRSGSLSGGLGLGRGLSGLFLGLLAAAGGQAEKHDHGHEGGQSVLVLEHFLFLLDFFRFISCGIRRRGYILRRST